MNPRSHLPSFRLLWLPFGLLLVTTLTRGQIIYNGATSGSDTWGIGSNWSGAVVPAASATVEFGNSLTNTPDIGTSSYTVAQINFTRTSNLTLDGSGTLTVTTGIANNSGASHTIAPALTLNGASAIAVSIGSGSSLTLEGDIGGTQALTKTGAGTLTLAGLNSFTGGTLINAGTLVIAGNTYSSDGSSPIGNGSITINGGTLAWGSINSGGFGGSSSYDASLKGIVIGSNGATFEVDTTNIGFSAALTGTGALVKTGADTLTLNAANTYGGATTVSAGTLQLGDNGSLPSGSALTVASGAMFKTGNADTAVGSIAGAGAITLGILGNLSVGGDNTSTTFSGPISDSGYGSFTKTGTGTLTLTGALSYDRGTTITGGTLVFGAANILGSAAYSANNTLTINGGTLSLGGFSHTIGGSTTLTSGALTNGNLTSASYLVQSGTVSASLRGTGTLTKNAGGTVTLSGANTYSGSTYVYGGTLALSGSGTLGNTSADLILNGGTLDLGGTSQTKGIVTFNSGTLSNGTLTGTAYSALSGTASAVLAGSGIALTKTTSDTLILSGANTYTGATTISAGTLQIGAGGATGSIAGTSIVNNAALTFNRTDANGSYAGVISGSGTLTQSGSGTTTLTGANTYTGTTTISGGTLQLGNGSTTGSIASTSIVNNGALVFNRSNAVTHSGAISGSGSLTQLGAGTLTLSGTYSYTGATTVSAGTLALGNNFSSTGALTVNGGTFDVGTRTATFSNLNNPVSVSGMAYLLSGTITGTTGSLNAWGYSVESGTVSVPLTGNGSLTKSTSGTVTLNAANTYTAGTTISAGTLALGASNRIPDTGTLTVSGGTLSLGAFSDTVPTLSLTSGSITGTGTLTVQNSAGVQSGTISANLTASSGTFGVPGLTKSGGGTVTLTGNASVSFGTTISGGTLQVGNGGTTGSLSSSAVSLTGGNLTFSHSDNLTFNGNISGNTFGSAVVNAGPGNVTLSGSLSMAYVSVTGSGTMTLASSITPTGGYDLIKSGSGTLITGSIGAPKLWVDAGTVRLDTGNGLNNANVAAGASLVFNHSVYTSLTGVISGAGSWMKSGSDTLSLTSSSNTISGGLTVTGGTVQFSTLANLGNGSVTLNGGGLRWYASTIDVSSRLGALGAGGGTFDTDGNNVTFASALSGSGALTKSGGGTLTLNSANTYTGGTTINAGTLALGASGALGSTGPIAFGGGTLQFSAANTSDYSARLSTAPNQTYRFDTNGQSVTFASALTSSGGSLIKYGTGTLTLSGANTYSGDTFVVAGTLALGTALALQNSTLTTPASGFSFGALTSATLGGLTGSNALALTNATSGSVALTVGNNHASTTYSGVLSGGGALSKVGSGTLTLIGTNTYSGGTTINAGTLQLGGNTTTLPSGGALTLGGGTFATGGFSQTLGALTLNGSATLDFGSGTSQIAFANSSAFSWSGGLSIVNYTTSVDSLRFGTTNTGLTPTQLSLLNFGSGLMAQIDTDGYVTGVSAIPEPSTYAAILGTLALAVVLSRKRRP